MNTTAVVRQIALLVALAAIAVAAIIWSGRDQDSQVPIAHTGRDTLTVVVLAHSDTDTVLHTRFSLEAPISALGALEQAAARDRIGTSSASGKVTTRLRTRVVPSTITSRTWRRPIPKTKWSRKFSLLTGVGES